MPKLLAALLALSCLAPVVRAQTAPVPPAAPAPASPGAFVVLSVAGGALTSGGKPVAAGAVLSFDAPLQLSRGRAILSAGGAGKVMLMGQTTATPRSGAAYGLELLKGAVLSSLPGLKGATFSVRTAVATAAVRGTDFYVETKNHSRAYICLCDGAIDVAPTGSAGQAGVLHLIAARPHTAWTFRRAKDGSLIQKSDVMRGHSDADLAELR